jgi:death-on-curing protein
MEPVFLTLDDVLEIHEQQIELYGGSHGLRDPGALESAVANLEPQFSEDALVDLVLGVAQGVMAKERIARFFEECTRPSDILNEQ